MKEIFKDFFLSPLCDKAQGYKDVPLIKNDHFISIALVLFNDLKRKLNGSPSLHNLECLVCLIIWIFYASMILFLL